MDADSLSLPRTGGREVRPAAQLLSFASPKESNQRKGDPTVCGPSGNLRYELLTGNRSNSLRSDNRGSSSRQKPASQAHTEGARGTALVALRATLQRNFDARLCRARGVVPTAVMRRRVAQGWADQGSRLFERSEFERDPDQTEQRSVPEAQRRDDEFGSPFFWELLCSRNFASQSERSPRAARLWRAKKTCEAGFCKSAAPAGARPGLLAPQKPIRITADLFSRTSARPGNCGEGYL